MKGTLETLFFQLSESQTVSKSKAILQNQEYNCHKKMEMEITNYQNYQMNNKLTELSNSLGIHEKCTALLGITIMNKMVTNY